MPLGMDKAEAWQDGWEMPGRMGAAG